MLFYYLAFTIPGVRLDAEPNEGHITFGELGEVLDKARGIAQADHQHTGGSGIQRASVPHVPLAR